MRDYRQFYINGQWVDPVEPRTLAVVNPATEEVYGRISLGSAADVDKAVAAARQAFETYSQTTREQRIDLLRAILDEFKKLLGPRTKLVAVAHVSNALGTINPVKEMVRIAHERELPVILDGAQATDFCGWSNSSELWTAPMPDPMSTGVCPGKAPQLVWPSPKRMPGQTLTPTPP